VTSDFKIFGVKQTQKKMYHSKMENEKILANGNSNVQKTKPTKQHIEVCVFDSIYYSHYYKTAIVYQALGFLPQFCTASSSDKNLRAFIKRAPTMDTK